MAIIDISPGQGLLMLIEHYKDNAPNVAQLKKLYLSGAEDLDAVEQVRALLRDDALSGYNVLYDAKTINNDPTRRHFETHLAYEALTHNLDAIRVDDLREHLDAIIALLPQGKTGEFFLEYMASFLEGEYRNYDPVVEIEFANYIKKIKNGTLFKGLSPDNKEKIELLVKSAFVAINAMEFAVFPMDIYGSGDFDKHYRGKIAIAGQKTTRNAHLGLMKGHMPLARDDLARDEEITPCLKPSDQSSFEADAGWVQSNFAKLGHPFSNSISGTMLAQLRVIAKLRDQGMVGFTESGEKLATFIQLFSSTLLFGSGGHTLLEFTTPITLPASREEFKSTPGIEKITLETMYLTDNMSSFDTALQSTINYNKMLLLREQLHADVKVHRHSPRLFASIERLELKRERLDAQQNVVQSMLAEREQFVPRIEKFNFGADTGARKNAMIKESLDEAISFIQQGDLPNATATIARLEERFSSEFGTINFLCQFSDSYKLILSLEKHLDTYQKSFRTIPSTSHIADTHAAPPEVSEAKKTS